MENLKFTPQQKELLDEILATPYYWAELPLEDLPDVPSRDRKIVVSGFNCPDLEKGNDERIYITIKRILIHKETKFEDTNPKSFEWEITANLKSIIPNQTIQKEISDAEGNIIETTEVPFKVPSVKFIRYLLLNKQAQITDLLESALADFANQFKTQLDTL